MARKPRIWYPDVIYRVMSRGSRRGELFKDRDDHISFLEYVQKIRKKHPFKIHSICLIDVVMKYNLTNVLLVKHATTIELE